ncbi:SusC/RagA family TonB-linked outer membrane protein [Carboxylicivirga marina]|uniref:SusC/RagA family TonB-linked outer membrane protein n=1 Tax=Carboxylicivirga marina TaxID=2800988 RepID=UPI0025982A27|nr:SusC/RagA family TonB-linked outer membrane protein [uncultured Carboxylicivirga sp.]
MNRYIRKHVLFGILVTISGLLTQGMVAQDVEQADSSQVEAKLIDVGFGYKQNLNESTRATSTVAGEQLQKNSKAFTAQNALYGQLAGLMALENGGEPWSRDASLMIRGTHTLNYNNILVIVDGFERDLSSIAMDDIETVTVLKDAASLAIYGNRGANGVLVVTTKRGDYNSFNVDLEYQRGVIQPFRLPEFYNAHDYAQAVNQANRLDGNAEDIYTAVDLDYFKNGSEPKLYPNVDWVDHAFRQAAPTNKFNSRFYGGGKSVRYNVSIGYQSEEGLFNYTEEDDRYNSQLRYDLFNIRANVDIDLTKTTLFSVGLGASLADMTYPGMSNGNTGTSVYPIMNKVYNTPSAAIPVRSVNGYWGGTNLYNQNPAAMLGGTGYRNDFRRELITNFNLKQDLSELVDGLSAGVSLAVDNSATYYEGKTKSYEYEAVTLIHDVNDNLINYTTEVLGYEGDLIDYDYKNGNFNELWQNRRSAFRANLDYESDWGQNNTIFASTFYSQDMYTASGANHTFYHQDMAGVVNLGFNDKYFVSASASYSGSSRLEEGSRFAFYPSVSAAWVLSNEDFLSGSKIVDFMKLRASWGLAGNDVMELYLYESKYGTTSRYWFGDNYAQTDKGLRQYQLATEDLKPETATISNVGIDMQLFNALSVSVDGFYEERSDILVDAFGGVSGVIGINPSMQNAGIVKNMGVDASLDFHHNLGDFNYHIGGNITYAKSEVVEKLEAYKPHDYMKQTGHAVGQYFGYEAIGFFKDDADIAASPEQLFSQVRPGDIKYKDQNGDNVIDEFDVTSIANSWKNPDLYFGINIGFEYKGFGANALFQGIMNQSVNLNTTSVYRPLANNTNISEFSRNSWTPETHETATLPRLSLLANPNNSQTSDLWIVKGDYFKLRNLEVFYNIPEKISALAKLSKAKVFVRGTNLFSVDNIEMLDAEATGMTYPTLQSYHLGLSVSF